MPKCPPELLYQFQQQCFTLYVYMCYSIYSICFTSVYTEYLLCVFSEMGSQDQKSSLSSHESKCKESIARIDFQFYSQPKLTTPPTSPFLHQWLAFLVEGKKKVFFPLGPPLMILSVGFRSQDVLLASLWKGKHGILSAAAAAAAAAAKSLQSYPTLCDPRDSSPPGSAIPGTLQARTLEWGCHFLLQCMKVKSESEVAQSSPTLSDPMDCSLPGSSIHGIFQARVLEQGAIAFSARKQGYI